MMDARQWEQSGHWGKYRENMFVIPDEIPHRTPRTKARWCRTTPSWMAPKPMNCPAHVLIFRQGIKSYRDLPLRLYENGCCHRNEPHGALHGLMRVRQFTQDDAHIFCREDQIVEEVRPSVRWRIGSTGLRLHLLDQAGAAPGKAFRHRRNVGQGGGELRAVVAAAASIRPNMAGRTARRRRLLCPSWNGT